MAVKLASKLFSCEEKILKKEFIELLENENTIIYLKVVNDQYIGFAQCQLRFDYVEGTDSSPVAYLEGIYIEDEHRGKGYAAELLKMCENWGKGKGCVEFASDCELVNIDSFNFHIKNGFEEANRIICFVKKLN